MSSHPNAQRSQGQYWRIDEGAKLFQLADQRRRRIAAKGDATGDWDICWCEVDGRQNGDAKELWHVLVIDGATLPAKHNPLSARASLPPAGGVLSSFGSSLSTSNTVSKGSSRSASSFSNTSSLSALIAAATHKSAMFSDSVFIFH